VATLTLFDRGAGLLDARQRMTDAPNESARFISALHRHSDFITFARRDDDGGLRDVRGMAFRPADVDTSPVAKAEVREDTYVSIHGMRKTWSNDQLCSQINAIALDIDFHDEPQRIDPAVLRIEQEWSFPRWSVMVRSGRGIWLLWFLREEDSELSIPLAAGDFAMRIRYRALHREFACSLPAGIKADPLSNVLNRKIRLPGSFNTEVEYGQVSYGPVDEAALHTMSELEGAFGINTPVSQDRHNSASKKVWVPGSRQLRNPNKAKGLGAMLAKRIAAMDKLIALRGGKIREPGRNNFAHILAATMRNRPGFEARVEHFGEKQCEPPLAGAEIATVLSSVERKAGGRWYCNITIGERLDINAYENSRLVEADLGDYLQGQASRPRRRFDRQTARRAAVKKYWRPAMTLGEFRAILRKEGIEANARTLGRDLDALKRSLETPKPAPSSFPAPNTFLDAPLCRSCSSQWEGANGPAAVPPLELLCTIVPASNETTLATTERA
jgi:hypothetical protein